MINANQKNQAGISLVLAILIMGAVSAVAVTMSILIINEVGTTKGINNAMKAFYTAESSIEQGTWIVREARRTGMKIDDAIDLLNNPPTGTLEDTAALWTRRASYLNQDITTNLRKDESLFLDLYNPQVGGLPPDYIKCWYDEYNDDETPPNPVTPGKLEITWSGWNASNGFCPQTTKKQWAACNGQDSLTLDYPIACNVPQRLRVQLRAFDGALTNLTLYVYDQNNQAIQIPSQVVIQAKGAYPNGSARSATQALRADVQWTMPVSGLFSYVLFSDQPLEKTE